MPVTAKLSRRFYETFGDELTNELVDWFNQVDLTYRSELREMNELNFARFDARVGERFAESDARIERRFSEFEGRLGDLRAELIRWMFVFWAGSTVTTAGLVIAAAKLL
ncbi:MAG TPA: hypothetical protein VH833_12925 [Gemmatimonadales bacterium]|jgi:hypothetical protein